MAKAPGKWFRDGMTLIEIVKFCEDEEAVEKMFIEARWPNGVACPKCGSLDVQEKENKRPQPFRCRDCKKFFSVKTDTVMHGSKIALGKWALASYIMTTQLEGREFHETTPRPGDYSESGMALDSPHKKGLGR